MNRNLKVYAEVDGFYDIRRGLLQWLLTENIHNDDELRQREGIRLWNIHMARNYAERRMDTFEYPQVGINKEKFDAAYKERKLENFLMYYPTNMCRQLFQKIIELEQLIEKPIDIKGVTLYVNTWPYEFDEAMKEEFVQHCFSMFGGRFEIKLQHIDVRKAEPYFYRQYNYVFKYDILGENSVTFQEKVREQPIPDVTFVVPDILSREADAFEGTVADRIFAWSTTLATVVKFIPIHHAFYDYAGDV